MNNQHPIDELFKQQLGQSSANVPTDMWDRIAAQRSQKRKPKLFWLWSSFGVLISAAAVYLLLLPISSLSMQLGSFKVENTSKNTPIASVNQTLQTGSNTFVESDQKNADFLNNNNTENHSINKEKSAFGQKTNAKINKQRFINKNNKSNKGFQTVAALKLSEKTNKNTEEVIIQNNDEKQQSIHPLVENETIEEGRISGPHQRRNRNVTKKIPALSFSLNQEKITLFTKSATQCARFANPFFHLDLEALSGPAYAKQKLSTRTSQSNAHLQKRKDSESPSLSYTAGLRLAATSHSGLGLKTGLVYSQINEKFEYLVGSRLETITIRDPNGNIIRIDTNYIEAYTATQKNKLKFLEVPLLVGFETKVGKFRVGVNAGAYLQLIFDAKGQIFSPATERPTDFGQRGDQGVLPIFDKRASAAWYIGASIAYNLHSRYSIIAEPYFKTFPRALSVPEYDLQQNYWTIGMQLGLRMRL